MPKIEDMKKNMPRTGVRDEEIEAIADRHGVDPDLLKITAPYLGARDYEKELSPESAAESLAVGVGKVGNMATLGFGKDAAIAGAGKLDPKMGDAMAELSQLAQEREPEIMEYGTVATSGLRGLMNKGFKNVMSAVGKDDKDKKKGSFGDTYGGGKDYAKDIAKPRSQMSDQEKAARAKEVASRNAERKSASDIKEAKADAGAEKSAAVVNKQYDQQATQRDPMFKSGNMEKPKPKTGEEWLKSLPDMTDKQKEAFLKLNADQQKTFWELANRSK